MYLGVIFVASRECMEMEHSCFCLHVQFILRFPLFLSCHFVVEILCLKEVTVRPPEKQHFIITFCFANEYPADSKYTPSKRLGQFSILTLRHPKSLKKAAGGFQVFMTPLGKVTNLDTKLSIDDKEKR